VAVQNGPKTGSKGHPDATNILSGYETFYAKMGKDGRITLPKLPRELLRGREQSLTGYVMEVTLKPAEEMAITAKSSSLV